MKLNRLFSFHVALLLLFFILTPHSKGAEVFLAHYPFDEGSGTAVSDSSGNNNHATISGATWATGRLGQALHFDGSNDRVDLGALDIPGNGATLMAWVYIDSFTGSSGDGRIISKADGVQENDHYWMLSTIYVNNQGHRLRFRLKTDGTTTTLIGGSLLSGRWLHTAAVYTGTTMILYIDGIEVARGQKSGVLSQNSSISAWIGDQPPTPGTRPWHGTIDDVRIYQSALTQTEIQLAMNNGNAFPSVTLLSPANNQVFSPGETIALSASASDSDGSVQVVEFYEGTNKIGEDFTSPYQASWLNVAEGNYQITAKAIDDKGSHTYSNPAHQIVVGSGPEELWIHRSTATGDIDPPTTGGNSQTASLVLDINRDGIDDFVITDRSTQPSVVWYESSDSGTWQRHVIDPDALDIEAGGDFADIDGDGDLDVMFGGDGSSNEIWWWENPFPDFSFRWTRRYIKNSGANKHHDQMFGDFDGDGRKELACWNQNSSQLLLFEIPADPRNSQPWTPTVIASASSSHEGMAVMDVDGDGIDDIVGAGRWYKHISGTTYSEFIVDTNQTFGRAAAGQFIPGGYSELVFGPGDSSGNLEFYRFNGSDWDSTLLKSGVDHGHSLHAADFDGDGNLDIFCAEMRLNGGNSDAKSWIFYGDGQGGFTEYLLSEGIGNHESRPGDFDGDGDIDILGKPYNWETPRIDIWLNRGTGSQVISLDLWQRHLIDSAMPNNSVFITAQDIDRDGHKDIIGGGWWWKNPGQPGGNWLRQTIGSPLNNMAAVYDVDGDGDFDIVGTTGVGSASSHEFRWAQNNGSGSFTILENISTGGSGDFLQGCLIDDFGAGNQLALSWHNDGGGVQSLTVPAQPAVTPWPFGTLSATTLSEDLSSGDIDRDGDTDLLLGTLWLENQSGSWTPHTLGQVSDLHSGAEPDRNDLGDIDKDGRLDAVVALENGTSVLWFKSPVDPQGLWERNIIGTVSGQGFSMDTADFDRDGDLDVVIGEHRGSSENRVIIFENTQNGTTWHEHIIDRDTTGNIDHHDGTQAVDIDGDGDLDIISVGWYNRKVWLYENRGGNTGGSNTPPVITQQPSSKTVRQGVAATFQVTATGSGTLSYQWQRNGIDIPYANSSTLHTSPVSLGDSGTAYSCKISNQYGQVTSIPAGVTVTPVAGTNGWWDEDFRYRFPIRVNPKNTPRYDHPANLEVNFTVILASLGNSAGFNPGSIRVVEVNSTGGIINDKVVFQFDKHADYHSSSNGSGELVFMLHGTTGVSEERYFHVYFDTVEKNQSAPSFPPFVQATDSLSHKGFDSVRIDTQTSTLYYHKSGGGFATLLDSDNNDWIGYVNNSTTGPSGWYRGIPNAVFPEDMMHPGRNGCLTQISASGPIRITLDTSCGEWASTWHITPASATMTMNRADHAYWIQYEGTPGGSSEPSDFITTSEGTTTTAASEWTADIAGSEWVYLGDNSMNRVIFASHHQKDSHSERFYRMDGGGGDGMVIFAFGRGSGTSSYMTSIPQQFTFGLIETKKHPAVSSSIEGIVDAIEVISGSAEGLAIPAVDLEDIYFGFVESGFSEDRNITLTNNGSADLVIGQIGQANPLLPPFYLIHDTCSGQTLQPGERCVITIRFIPPDQGKYSDSFDIPTNGHPPTLTVNLFSGSKPFSWHMFIPAFQRHR